MFFISKGSILGFIHIASLSLSLFYWGRQIRARPAARPVPPTNLLNLKLLSNKSGGGSHSKLSMRMINCIGDAELIQVVWSSHPVLEKGLRRNEI